LARVVCQRGGQTDARPLLRSLHWLPVKQRVTYKMATLTFKELSSSTPAYLNDLIHPAVLFGRCDLPTPRCCMLQEHELNSHGGHSQLQLHTSLRTSDIRSCHIVYTFTNTSKHTCSDSLSLKPPAPSYPLKDLKALYKCCIITFRVSRIDDAKCIVVTRLCVSVCLSVCLSVRGRMPTLLHGPGCNLWEL